MGQWGRLSYRLELPSPGPGGRVTLGGSAPQQGSRVDLQEVERENPPQDSVGLCCLGTGVLGASLAGPQSGLRASAPPPRLSSFSRSR